jgi:hypothetical protein
LECFKALRIVRNETKEKHFIKNKNLLLPGSVLFNNLLPGDL